MAIINKLYWAFEGIMLGVLMVVITLPAAATVFFEDPVLGVGYVLALLVIVTTGWFYISWRILHRTTAEAVENGASDSC